MRPLVRIFSMMALVWAGRTGLHGVRARAFAAEGKAGPVPALEDKRPMVLVETTKLEEIADVITYPARVISTVKGSILAPSDGVVTRVLTPLGSVVEAHQQVIEVRNNDLGFDYRPVKVETPVGGVIATVDITEGSAVNKGQTLLTVTDPRKIELRLEVPAADLGSFHRGLEGEFKVAVLDEVRAMPVVVHGVSPLVDPITGTATAAVGFAHDPIGKHGRVPVGALGKVAFSINKRRGIQVAEQAIIYRGKETLVRTVVGGKAHLVPVVIGETYRGRTEVLSGLVPGEAVVVSASSFIG